MARQIVVELVGKDDKLSASFAHAQKQGGVFGNIMTGIGQGVGQGLFGLATRGLDMVTGALTDAFAANEKQQQLDAQTTAAIKATGSAAGVTTKQVLDYAQSLGDATGIQHQNIQTGQNMLLTFTGIKNAVGAGNDIFNQATAAMTDMATKMAGGAIPTGEQMQTTSIQLGKALNDPIKGITALSKVGVSFTEDQKKQIKTMVEAGDTMGAQKVILAELNHEFGGSAEAFGKTDAGMKAIADNKMGDAIQKMIEPVNKLAVILMPIFADVLTNVANWLANVEVAAGPVISQIVTKMTPAFKVIAGVIGGVAKVTFPLLWNAAKVLANIFSVEFAIVSKVVGAAINVISGIITVAGKVYNVVGPIFRAMAGVIGGAFKGIGGVISGAFNSVIGAINWVISKINGIQVHIHVGPVGYDFNGLHLPYIPKMHSGGIVPGAVGADVPTILQAGELVVPRGSVGTGRGVTINIESFTGSDHDIDLFAEKVAYRLRMAGA